MGNEDNNPKDAYSVLDLKNRTIMITQDVRWLGKTFGGYFGVQGPKIIDHVEVEESDDENYIILRAEKTKEKEVEPEKERSRGMITRSKALLDNLEEETSDSEDEEGNCMVVSEEMAEPTTFNEAFFDKDQNRRNSWRKAISKELENMEKCNVWSVISKSTIPNNRKLIGNKSVFKEKRDGVFRARFGSSRILTSPRDRFHRKLFTSCE